MIAYQCFPLYVDPMKLNFYLIVRSFPFRYPAGMGGLYNANDVPARRRQTHKHKLGDDYSFLAFLSFFEKNDSNDVPARRRQTHILIIFAKIFLSLLFFFP